MLKQLRQQVVENLWETYRESTPQMMCIEAGLKEKGINKLILDHFAIIDLPGPHTGIPFLKQIFSALGYVERGKDFLADKQNDFLWMAESDSLDSLAQDVLPQVVVADFRLDEMPTEIKHIIEKYAKQAKPAPLSDILELIKRTSTQDKAASHKIIAILSKYFAGRDWPLPTLKEFDAVRSFNELLAWVLVFGRRPNHFTLSVHLLNHFSNLNDFHRFVEDDMTLALNRDGGEIKGGNRIGIAQGSTTGAAQAVNLADGTIDIPTGFVEFVWRYPKQSMMRPPLWNDFFTGFVASHADRVIESLYHLK